MLRQQRGVADLVRKVIRANCSQRVQLFLSGLQQVANLRAACGARLLERVADATMQQRAHVPPSCRALLIDRELAPSA
jgi:hypothetical protein